jgi:hypothetical protein
VAPEAHTGADSADRPRYDVARDAYVWECWVPGCGWELEAFGSREAEELRKAHLAGHGKWQATT